MTTLKYTLASAIISFVLLSCSSSSSEQTSELTKNVNNSTSSTSSEIAEKTDDLLKEIKSTDETVTSLTEEAQETVDSKEQEIKDKIETNVDKVKTEIAVNASNISETPTPIEENTSAVVEEIKTTTPTPTPAVQAIAFTHEIFDDLLKKYVTSSGGVNYNGFKSERTKLQTYLKLLKNNEPKSSSSQNEKLAYWINTYNAFTIELILKNYPTSSIMNINGGKAWDLKFVTIGENTYSLNDVEHNIIRKRFKEPRIHFACVCAAKSCPKLLNKAYTESNLNSSLDIQTKYFINQSGKNQISSSSLKLSKLFDWYAGDFGDVKTYIKKYSTTSFDSSASISFLDYNWDLNKQ